MFSITLPESERYVESLFIKAIKIDFISTSFSHSLEQVLRSSGSVLIWNS